MGRTRTGVERENREPAGLFGVNSGWNAQDADQSFCRPSISGPS
jgi:hypothetical protein